MFKENRMLKKSFGEIFGKKLKKTKKTKKINCVIRMFIFFVVGSISLFSFSSFADDLLNKAFAPTVEQDLIIDVGSTKESVGHSVTKRRTSYEISIKDGFKKESTEPLLVVVSKLLLKFTVVLSVTMIIYNTILYGMKVMGGDDYKSKESLKKLGTIGLGIVLALSSLGLIELIRSLSHTFLQK